MAAPPPVDDRSARRDASPAESIPGGERPTALTPQPDLDTQAVRADQDRAPRAGIEQADGRQLNIATTVLWRGPGVVQFELGDKRMVAGNVEPAQLAALLARRGGPGRNRAPDPSRSSIGHQPAGGADLAQQLDRAGFLTHRQRGTPARTRMPAYLSADYQALVGRYGDDAARILRRRRRSAVAVHGTSRITATIATTLAGAGVGHVHVVGGGEVSASDSCPGGVGIEDEGSRFGIAGVAAVRRHSQDVITDALTSSRFADLVILTESAPVEATIRDSLHLDGVAHLASSVAGSRAVIGPLVLPGRSSCLHCADLHRTDRDPCWPALAVQLSEKARHHSFSDVALCVAAAGLAAGQALDYLDGRCPETVDGTLEWQLPHWQLRRRSWPPHHDCDCGSASAAARRGRMEW